MKRRQFPFEIALVLLAMGLAASAFAQQAPPPPPQTQSTAKAEKPKAKRVWTNDDVEGVRKPWDEYQEQKAKEADKKREQQSAAARIPNVEPKGTPLAKPDYLPKTLQEAERRLLDKAEEINFQKQAIAKVRDELDKAAEGIPRQQLQKRLDELTTDLKEAELEYDAIRGRLEALKAKSSPKTTPPNSGE